MKMEQQILLGIGEVAEGPEKFSHASQPDRVEDFPRYITSKWVKQDPEGGQTKERECQWQEFLKALDYPPSEWETSPTKDPGPWDDAKAFLASFEQVAEACQWPREEWAARLLPALSGEAEQAFGILDVKDRGNYGKVKAAILRGNSLRMESRRQHFRQFCYRDADDPRRVYSQLRELCHRWLKPERHTKEQILELLILEQFLAILPPEIQNWVRECGPENCVQTASLAEEFLMSQPETDMWKWQVSLPSKDMIPSPPSCGERDLYVKAKQGKDDPDAGRPDGGMIADNHISSPLPLETWDTAEAGPAEGSVDLEVAVHFSEGKWALLDPGQRALYREVLQQNYGNVTPLGTQQSVFEDPLILTMDSENGKASEVIVQEVSKKDLTDLKRERPPEGRPEQLIDSEEIPLKEEKGPTKSILFPLKKGKEGITHVASPRKDKNEHLTDNELVTRDHFSGLLHQPASASEVICDSAVSPQDKEVKLTDLLERRNNTLKPEEESSSEELVIEEEKEEEHTNDKEVKKEETKVLTACVMDSVPSESEAGSIRIREDEGLPALGTEEIRQRYGDLCQSSAAFQEMMMSLRAGWLGEKEGEPSLGSSDRLQLNRMMWGGDEVSFPRSEGQGSACASGLLESRGPISIPFGGGFFDFSEFAVQQSFLQKKSQEISNNFGASLSQASQLADPENGPTAEKPYQCNECGKCFGKRSTLNTHVRTHTGEKPYKCSHCEKRFCQNSHLQLHERTHTGEKPYKCLLCEKSYNQRSSLIIHERSHTGEKPYTCTECGKSFSQKATLVLHEKSHRGDKPYKCLECGKGFSLSADLIRHQSIHTGEKPYTCSECGKSFSQNSHLMAHIRTHTGEKPHKCLECGKGFNWSSELIAHERIHTGEKPYLCMYCEKSFSVRSSLSKHERTHTGEKPYICLQCGKGFIQRSSLVAHERSHTGERPYMCLDCGKCFRESSQLIAHERTHSSEKPYVCPECGRCFKAKGGLIRHQRSHLGVNSFICADCGKIFSSSTENPEKCPECVNLSLTSDLSQASEEAYPEAMEEKNDGIKM